MSTRAIQARAPDALGGSVTIREPQSPRSGSRSAEALHAEVRRLLRDGEIRDACRLVTEAVAQHPDHPGLRRTHEVLNVGRSYNSPATGQSTPEAIEWLSDPPDEYRGKWVALIGREVVGSAESLKELLAGLPPDLEQTPLAVQIAS